MQFSGEAAFLLAQELKRLAGSAGVPRSKGHAGAKSFQKELRLSFSRFAVICTRNSRGPSNSL